MLQGLLPDDPRALGPYRLLARWPGTESGSACAAMYLGRDRELRPAVLCRLPASASEAATELGLRPVSGVPAIRELSTDAEPGWAALAYTPAVSLSDLSGGAGAGTVLTPDQVAALGGAVATTLTALHGRGIVYGAVSPQGVWLTTGRPLLMALHACRTVPSPAVRAAARQEPFSRVSTVPVAFMAPEVAAGATAPSPAADVYALGMLLVRAATGRLPFGDGPPPALAYRALHDRPDLHGVPRGLAEVVTAALAPRPEDRPTAAALVRTPALRPDEAGWPGAPDHGVEPPPDRPGPPPGRVVAALAVRAQQVAELDADTDAERSAGPATEPATRLLGRGASAGADPAGTAGAPAAATRRALLAGLVTGAAGVAFGVAGTLAWQGGSGGGEAAAPARAPRRRTSGPVPGLPPAALWRFDDDVEETRLLPVTGAGRFLVERNQTLYGHDLSTGEERWDLPDLRGYSVPQRVSGDRVLVATNTDLKLCSLRDGRVEWADKTLYRRDTTVGTVLAAAGDTAWLLIQPYLTDSAEQSLAAFDIVARRERWRTPLPRGFERPLSVTVAGGTLIVEVLPEDDPHRDPYATRSLSIAGFDRDTGAPLWKRTYRGVYSGPSSVVDTAGRLFLLSAGSAHAYDPAAGRGLWESRSGADAEHGPPLRAGSLLCMTGRVTNVVAVDANTGRRRWDQDLDEELTHYRMGSMAVSSSGRTLFVPTQQQVAALDLRSGERLWQLAVVGLEEHHPLQLVTAPGALLIAQPSAIFAIPTR
ncbi:PQQ-binding-like beta-propeller repeat protein [Streptomyces sp. SAJ15]|uniref:outer membrane protein assembly factor BamB family protein n=1 Tax=Streptomyces sp. SAJ15 TaxID=2011095 RepID=UPI0021B2026F|nr:PQQ-binding-like beta-propeller repeat protein [Streptomyces sp. SAJ15]